MTIGSLLPRTFFHKVLLIKALSSLLQEIPLNISCKADSVSQPNFKGFCNHSFHQFSVISLSGRVFCYFFPALWIYMSFSSAEKLADSFMRFPLYVIFLLLSLAAFKLLFVASTSILRMCLLWYSLSEVVIMWKLVASCCPRCPTTYAHFSLFFDVQLGLFSLS